MEGISVNRTAALGLLWAFDAPCDVCNVGPAARSGRGEIMNDPVDPMVCEQ